VIVGERDTIVPSAGGANVIKEAAKSAGNHDVSVVTFKDADHFVYRSKTGGPREMIESAGHRVLVPEYLTTVSDWIIRKTKAAESANLVPGR
jgi:pimeloyl-ACP methyl ester carboxylesterase